jgi:hypothetical protein
LLYELKRDAESDPVGFNVAGRDMMLLDGAVDRMRAMKRLTRKIADSG